MRICWLLTALIVLGSGCGGAKAGKKARLEAAAEKGSLGTMDDGARCETEGRREALIDLNQDEKADVRKIYLPVDEGEVLVCREADLNFDGIKDIFVFYGRNGQLTRDEVDLDYDGNIDIISTYAKGKVIKQEIDTNSDGLVDRVRHLQDDLPVRVEGDTDGDRRIDYWEYYEAGKVVRIGVDADGDGRADDWSRDDETEAAAFAKNKPKEEDEAEEKDAEEDGAKKKGDAEKKDDAPKKMDEEDPY